MSVDHLFFEWWMEGDWLWVRHDCNGKIEEWHPDSRWSAKGTHPEPSFQCDGCGRHTVLTESDRVEPPVAVLLDKPGDEARAAAFGEKGDG